MKLFAIPAAVVTALYILTLPASAEADFKLKLQSYYPSAMLNAETAFADTVNQESNGRIEIQLFSGGELVPTSQILNAVKTGTIDIGRGIGHLFTETPIGAIEAGMPMAWTSVEEANRIFFDLGLRDIVAEEYGKHGVKYLGPVWAAPYHFLSKRPIKSLDDMRSMKIRAVGASAKMLAEVGVQAVSMPPEDIYLALTTGQLDGVLYGSAYEYKETKYYEGARFFNTTPVVDPITDALVINPDVWAAMPADLQEIIQNAADTMRDGYYDWVTKQDAETIDSLFRNTTTSFSDEDVRTMTQAALRVWEEEAKRSDANAQAVTIIIDNAKAAGRL